MDDRSRLKEVHQTDLTEGRINQDFLDWLQTKGTTWLLVALVGLCIYLGLVRWRGHQDNTRAEAWRALSESQLPSSLEDVAEKYQGVDAVADLARLRAAQTLLYSVQSGHAIGGSDVKNPPPLTAEDRERNLQKADGLLSRILSADDGSRDKSLMMIAAMNGRAAVAESQGKLDDAKALYERAAQRADRDFPALASQARERAATVSAQNRVVALPTQADVARLGGNEDEMMIMTQPPQIDGWIRDLILPNDTGG
jgi:hypothetical protein